MKLANTETGGEARRLASPLKPHLKGEKRNETASCIKHKRCGSVKMSSTDLDDSHLIWTVPNLADHRLLMFFDVHWAKGLLGAL